MLWDIAHLFIEVGAGGVKKLYGKRQVEIKEGCDLDELQSHMVLEKLGETLTVRALRKRMEELDVDNNKRMSISEYLIAKFRKTPKELVNSPQGDGDEAELRKAQAMLDAAQEALSVAQEALENSKKEAGVFPSLAGGVHCVWPVGLFFGWLTACLSPARPFLHSRPRRSRSRARCRRCRAQEGGGRLQLQDRQPGGHLQR